VKAACEQALKEEGRLDVFFANVRDNCSNIIHKDLTISMQAGIVSLSTLETGTVEQFTEAMRVNALSYVLPERLCMRTATSLIQLMQVLYCRQTRFCDHEASEQSQRQGVRRREHYPYCLRCWRPLWCGPN
jgi:hypothetical protein